MKFEKLVKMLNKAHAKNPGGDVEFWLGDEEVALEIDSIGRFGFVPDVVFHLKEITGPVLKAPKKAVAKKAVAKKAVAKKVTPKKAVAKKVAPKKTVKPRAGKK